MKQILIKKGKLLIEETADPAIEDNAVLIKVSYSTISLGTEMKTLKNANKSLWQKAIEKPEKVQKVIKKLVEEGPGKAMSFVTGELNVSKPLGYSVSGLVMQVGKNVKSLQKGDYVAAAGGTANHAELVVVPEMLVVKLDAPDKLKEVSSVAIGSIALHGVRRAGMQLGELCVVFGVGTIGLLTVQLLVNAGVRILAVDLDERKLTLAKKYGAEMVVMGDEKVMDAVMAWSGHQGVDGVIFTASTASSEPLNKCFRMCRKKGKVVLVGVSGMEINRKDMYENEIDFLISTSYGPGRYDHNYEQLGYDYPIGYVRWTEKRNMAEYVRLLTHGKVHLDSIITDTYKIEEVQHAFNPPGDKLSLLNILEYEGSSLQKSIHFKKQLQPSASTAKIKVGVIGIGAFAKNTTLPVLNELNNYFQIIAICNRSSHKARDLGQQYKVKYISSDPKEVIGDPEIELVVITTNHKNHGRLVLEALQHEKNVFVEKPLAITETELQAIEAFYKDAGSQSPVLMVGYNRRFSSIINKIKNYTDKRSSPLYIHYRMNVGALPYDHWIFREGGRIIGEACHIVDLMTYLTGSILTRISIDHIGDLESKFSLDNKSVILKYADGSIVSFTYFRNGAEQLSKEYMEVHFDQKSIIMDDYKSLVGYGIELKMKKMKKSNKGHLDIWKTFGAYLQGDTNARIIPIQDLITTTRATFLIDKS